MWLTERQVMYTWFFKCHSFCKCAMSCCMILFIPLPLVDFEVILLLGPLWKCTIDWWRARVSVGDVCYCRGYRRRPAARLTPVAVGDSVGSWNRAPTTSPPRYVPRLPPPTTMPTARQVRRATATSPWPTPVLWSCTSTTHNTTSCSYSPVNRRAYSKEFFWLCTISKVHVWCHALTLSKVTTS